MRRRPGVGLVALAAAATCAAAAAGAQDLRASASMTPGFVRLGQVATYTGSVVVPPGGPTKLRFAPPDSSDALTWGRLRAARHRGRAGFADTIVVQAEVQAFRLGNLVIPGLGFFDDAATPIRVRRLPGVRLTVVPVIPAGDSTADLHPVRGPIKAPWWEVVPWGWVIGLGLAAALLVWLVRRLRRRPAVVTQPVKRLDPAEAALARLQQLRRRRLPEAGEFGLHALELTAILRRYLEATTTRLRPGFTTAELTTRLQAESVSPDDSRTLLNLMRVWDRVKFAQAPFTVDEARRSEAAVEQFVRRRKPAARPEAA